MSEPNETYGFIYKIEFPNGKVYIGQTSRTLEQRKREHIRNAKKGVTYYVYNELRYYNMVDTFELIEIDTADTKEELDEKEMRYIQIYNSMDREYGCNRTMGGDGFIGYIHTEEDRKKISESRKKFHKENPEAGKKHGERRKQYFIDNPVAGEKHSKALKKYYEENTEAREKQSERRKQYFIDNPEAGRKHGEIMKKAYEKPGAREKHSEAQKKRFENPEEKQKFLDARGKNKPFDVFTKDGTFVKTFTYQMDAKEYLQKEYGITTFHLSAVLRGVRKSSAGFVFKYK